MTQGTKLRKAGFGLADPNGNGLCSLAEIEGFIKGTLCKHYPKQVPTLVMSVPTLVPTFMFCKVYCKILTVLYFKLVPYSFGSVVCAVALLAGSALVSVRERPAVSVVLTSNPTNRARTVRTRATTCSTSFDRATSRPTTTRRTSWTTKVARYAHE